MHSFYLLYLLLELLLPFLFSFTVFKESLENYRLAFLGRLLTLIDKVDRYTLQSNALFQLPFLNWFSVCLEFKLFLRFG
jgi:hypothetical protein